MSKKTIESYIEVFRQLKRYIYKVSDSVKDEASIEDMAVIMTMLDRLINRIERKDFRLFTPRQLKRLEKMNATNAEEFNARLQENEGKEDV